MTEVLRPLYLICGPIAFSASLTFVPKAVEKALGRGVVGETVCFFTVGAVAVALYVALVAVGLFVEFKIGEARAGIRRFLRKRREEKECGKQSPESARKGKKSCKNRLS